MSTSWTPRQWAALDQQVLTRAGRSPSAADREIVRAARGVLRDFSSSFFLVTRFLPASKRSQVEIIYAAVRYPDEVVDTFELPAGAKLAMLDAWERSYVESLQHTGVTSSLAAGVPWIVAAFREVIRKAEIPAIHYIWFLDAMRRDLHPRPFRNLDDLIENYVHGSAIVVGYFLAHVYGTATGVAMREACRVAANLGIALQLTNFARDVGEDRRRGRMYIPADMVNARGLDQAIVELAEHAEERYDTASRSVDVFASDSRPAIRACIDVYRLLNQRILTAPGPSDSRHSVPAREKFNALPVGKYWRLPLAFLGGL